jgi:hypothetical protein
MANEPLTHPSFNNRFSEKKNVIDFNTHPSFLRSNITHTVTMNPNHSLFMIDY